MQPQNSYNIDMEGEGGGGGVAFMRCRYECVHVKGPLYLNLLANITVHVHVVA